ncbi:hypothetical protein PENSPDRAFT_650670, partial [Peniophora sp. CONT]
MLVTPEATVLAIGATRMFRSLNIALRGEGGGSEMFTNGVSRERISTMRFNEMQLSTVRSGNAAHD